MCAAGPAAQTDGAVMAGRQPRRAWFDVRTNHWLNRNSKTFQWRRRRGLAIFSRDARSGSIGGRVALGEHVRGRLQAGGSAGHHSRNDYPHHRADETADRGSQRNLRRTVLSGIG